MDPFFQHHKDKFPLLDHILSYHKGRFSNNYFHMFLQGTLLKDMYVLHKHLNNTTEYIYTFKIPSFVKFNIILMCIILYCLNFVPKIIRIRVMDLLQVFQLSKYTYNTVLRTLLTDINLVSRTNLRKTF